MALLAEELEDPKLYTWMRCGSQHAPGDGGGELWPGSAFENSDSGDACTAIAIDGGGI